MSTSAPEQGEQPQDPQTPVAAPAAAAPAIGDGPWANDLNLIFTDPNQRAQVDQFLRTKVQPHTTKLEQELAQTRDAQKLWNDLGENPGETFVAVARELYGEEAATAAVNAMQAALDQGQQQQAQQPAPAQLPPEIQNMYQSWQEEQNEKVYDATVAKIVASNPDILEGRFHHFVASANGDFDKAVILYREDLRDLAAGGLVSLNQGDPPPVPPPVTGSDAATAQSSAAPVLPAKESLQDAIRATAALMRTNAEAPPIS